MRNIDNRYGPLWRGQAINSYISRLRKTPKNMMVVMVKDLVGKFVGLPFTQLIAWYFTVGGATTCETLMHNLILVAFHAIVSTYKRDKLRE